MVQDIKYIANGKLEEELLMCMAIFGTCTGEDIFSAVDTRLQNYGLSWEWCISICTDEAGAMVGKHKGFLARVLQIALHINFTHCIIDRENVASKKLDQQLKCILDSAVKIVNYIKSRPLQTRLFAILCDETGSEHKSLLLHSEVRWLSQAAYNKIKAFIKKIQHWANRVQSGRMDMFSELNDFFEKNEFSQNIGKQSIISHLHNLSQWFDKYFPEDTTPQQHDWILAYHSSLHQKLTIYHQI
ncbi:zinc finger BED domain-containing protein 5-like [Clavelina lepadiformis]|uniref:zinc finger BED domain-containing protein 5-like n=1 Tax=Clavelina lepadiformis TaxID=159417 RepID=UPI0040410671